MSDRIIQSDVSEGNFLVHIKDQAGETQLSLQVLSYGEIGGGEHPEPSISFQPQPGKAIPSQVIQKVEEVLESSL